MASSLSTHDQPTAGSTAGGGLAEDKGFFPFSVRFGAMAVGRRAEQRAAGTQRRRARAKLGKEEEDERRLPRLGLREG